LDNGKEIYRSIKVTDNTKTASLSLMDQVRLIFAKMSNDSSAELDVNERVSVERLKKLAGLTDFLQKAIKNMHRHGESSVTVQLSSEFLPYLDDVIGDKRGLGQFYDFNVESRDLPISVKHFVIVRISKKLERSSVGWGMSGESKRF